MWVAYIARYDDTGEVVIVQADRDVLDTGHGATKLGLARVLRTRDGKELTGGNGVYRVVATGRTIRCTDLEAP